MAMQISMLLGAVALLKPAGLSAALVEECDAGIGTAVLVKGRDPELRGVLRARRDFEVDGREIRVDGRLLPPVQAMQVARGLGRPDARALCASVGGEFSGFLVRWTAAGDGEEAAAGDGEEAAAGDGEAPQKKRRRKKAAK